MGKSEWVSLEEASKMHVTGMITEMKAIIAGHVDRDLAVRLGEIIRFLQGASRAQFSAGWFDDLVRPEIGMIAEAKRIAVLAAADANVLTKLTPAEQEQQAWEAKWCGEKSLREPALAI